VKSEVEVSMYRWIYMHCAEHTPKFLPKGPGACPQKFFEKYML